MDRKAIEFHLSHDLAKAKDKENKKRKAENAIKAFTKIIEFCETAKLVYLLIKLETALKEVNLQRVSPQIVF